MWSFPPGQRATFQWNSGDVTAVVAVQGRTGVDGWRRNNSALISSLTEVKFVMSVGSTPCSWKEKHSSPPVTVQANKEQENIEICVTFDVTIQWSAQQNYKSKALSHLWHHLASPHPLRRYSSLPAASPQKLVNPWLLKSVTIPVIWMS